MRCPICADPHGGFHPSTTHTYRPGCSLFESFLALVMDAREVS